MAIQEWIAMRKDIHGDPAVLRIAQKLKQRPELVVGYLHRVWSWFDDQSDDGVIRGVTLDTLEAHLALPNFLHLMVEVGWLECIEDPIGVSIQVPKWDRWLAKSAKKRLKNARRSDDYRARKNVRVSAHEKRTRSSSSSSSSSLKKEEKEYPLLPFSSKEFAELWADFRRHRVALKAKTTTRADRLILRKLEGLTERQAIACLEQSIERGWKSVFPDKPVGKSSLMDDSTKRELERARKLRAGAAAFDEFNEGG